MGQVRSRQISIDGIGRPVGRASGSARRQEWTLKLDRKSFGRRGMERQNHENQDFRSENFQILFFEICFPWPIAAILARSARLETFDIDLFAALNGIRWLAFRLPVYQTRIQWHSESRNHEKLDFRSENFKKYTFSKTFPLSIGAIPARLRASESYQTRRTRGNSSNRWGKQFLKNEVLLWIFFLFIFE